MSDERVNVSKGLLDNLSDSVQVLTGTTENMSIQEMSNAVSAKANESFELIETIVLTEEVSIVERTKEPDGADYNFKEMLVKVKFFTREKLENNYPLGAVRISFGSYNSLYFTKATISNSIGLGQTLILQAYGKIDKKLSLAYSSLGLSQSAYAPNNMAVGGNFGYTTKNSLDKFTISTEQPFPVVTSPIIEIYGIRA